MAKTPITRKYNLETLMNGLNDREQVFVAEYMVDGNATRAATVAGYKGGAIGSALVKREKISKVIAALKYDYLTEKGLEQEQVLEQLKYCLLRQAGDFIDPETGVIYSDLRKMPKAAQCSIDGIEQKVTEKVDPDTGEVTRHIETKLKLVPKNPTMELAMKHFGMLAPQQQEVKVTLDLSQLYGKPEEAPNVIDIDNLPLIESDDELSPRTEG